MDLRLLYFDGCPNWIVLRERLFAALEPVALEATVELVQVTSTEAADRRSFRGSPSLLDGRDPFADESGPLGPTCLLYATPDGLQGAPTVEQLIAALAGSYVAG